MNVPYLDLAAHHRPIRAELDRAIGAVIDANAFVSGPAVRDFEAAFAGYVGAKHCVAVGSGTDALHVALLAMGVGPGDEVITQANTFIATIEAILYTGARCVLVDVAPPTYTIDIGKVAEAITARTKAIVPVHLFGQPCDIAAIRALAREKNIAILEDASQAHGAEVDGARIGSTGVAGWSFYPGKNLGALGEGGGVTCDDDDVAAQIRVLIDHGSAQKYVHRIVGYNYRMDGIQGAALGVKVRHLEEWVRARGRVAEKYNAAFVDVSKPRVPGGIRHAWHVYPLFVRDRDAARDALAAEGIGSNVHYPIPVHLQEGYSHLGYAKGSFPGAEFVAAHELSLPIYPEISDAQVQAVIDSVSRIVVSA